jgi:antitoxin component of MazEF toxin-antitoxin module
MCSINVWNCVDKALKQKTEAKETFTAYDITKAARKLTDEEFLHGDVKNYIHDELDELVTKGKYTKTLVPSVSWRAYEYAPVTTPSFQVKLDDAQKKKLAADNMFKKICSNLAALPPKIKRSVSNTPIPAQPSSSADGKRGNRKRVTVPKNLLIEIGAKPKQRVNIYPTGPGKAMITQSVVQSVVSANYTIDCKGNFKISNSVLENFGFSETDEIKFSVAGHRILIDKK